MVSRITGIFKRPKIGDDCREVRELSSDYIDGELDKATVGRLKSHLEKCGPCNAFVNTLRATVRFLGAAPKRKPPSDFRRRIQEKVREDRSQV